MSGNDKPLLSRTGRPTEPHDPLDRFRRFVPELTSPRSVTASLSRYDLVLTIIPAAFVFALLADALFSLSPRTAMVGASLVAVLVLVDALFVNPPRDTS